jgi:cobalt-zinc-cadmium efflux system outer membrane protein
MLQRPNYYFFVACLLLGTAPEFAPAQGPAPPTGYAPPPIRAIAPQQAAPPPVVRYPGITPLPKPTDDGAMSPPVATAPVDAYSSTSQSGTPRYGLPRPHTQAASPVVPAAYHDKPAYTQPVVLSAFNNVQPMPPVPTNNPGQPTPPTAEAIGPGTPENFRLDQLVGLTLTYNPILRRELAEVEAAMGERVQAGLYPNPTMETNNPELFAGQASQVNFGFMQLIKVKGKLRLDKAIADQGVRSEAADYLLERAKLLTEVRKQYYRTLAAKHRVYLARHLTSIAERGLNGARQLEKAGEGTITDVLLLDTDYQREQIRLQNAETTYQGELKQLAAIVGMPEILIRDVEGTLFDAPPQFSEQDVVQFVNRTSSYVERARAEIVQSQAQLRRQEVEPYPDLRAGPSFQTGTISHSAQYWLTIEFDIPVWNLNQGNIRKANATVHEQLADLEVLRNELNRKTAELFARHTAARDRAERIRVQILPNAQRAQHLIQDAYIKGQFDVNRLLESQRNLIEVSSDYFEAAEESWVTAAELAGMLQLEQFP